MPVLEKVSSLKFNVDFYTGYSLERINSCDKEHTVSEILKVIIGSTEKVAEYVDLLYKQVTIGGTHEVSSVRLAKKNYSWRAITKKYVSMFQSL